MISVEYNSIEYKLIKLKFNTKKDGGRGLE